MPVEAHGFARQAATETGATTRDGSPNREVSDRRRVRATSVCETDGEMNGIKVKTRLRLGLSTADGRAEDTPRRETLPRGTRRVRKAGRPVSAL